jgi:hypothetical protein
MFLKTTSHRSREKLHFELRRSPQYYFTSKVAGCFVKLEDSEEIKKALEIKGITKCRDQKEESYNKCWETGVTRHGR